MMGQELDIAVPKLLKRGPLHIDPRVLQNLSRRFDPAPRLQQIPAESLLLFLLGLLHGFLEQRLRNLGQQLIRLFFLCKDWPSNLATFCCPIFSAMVRSVPYPEIS